MTPQALGASVSYDGESLYLSEWYKHRIVQFDASGDIQRVIGVGAEICGRGFVDQMIYVLRGMEQGSEDWCIARLDPRQETPEVEGAAQVPFQGRSLTFDGAKFWTNHPRANEIVSFALRPNRSAVLPFSLRGRIG